MCRQTPWQHPPKPCPGQPGWGRHRNEQRVTHCKYCHVMLWYPELILIYTRNCTQSLIQCLGVFWTITHKASWNNCHYFAFMFKKFSQEVGGCFHGLFFLLWSHYLPPTEINNSSLSHHMHSSAWGNTPWFVGFSPSSHKMLHQFWQCKK